MNLFSVLRHVIQFSLASVGLVTFVGIVAVGAIGIKRAVLSDKAPSVVPPVTFPSRPIQSPSQKPLPSIENIVSDKQKPTPKPLGVQVQATTQVVYLSAFTQNTKCLTEGVDAVKTADAAAMSSATEANKCAKEKGNSSSCIASCDNYYNEFTFNICPNNYESWGYTGYEECVNRESEKRNDCYSRCFAEVNTSTSVCFDVSKQQEASLRQLVNAYCNR